MVRLPTPRAIQVREEAAHRETIDALPAPRAGP
jgi:hypothetical protein